MWPLTRSARPRVARASSAVTRRRRLAAAALVTVLVGANVVLLALLLDRPAPAESGEADPGLIDAFSIEPTGAPTPTPTPTPTPEPPPETEPPRVVLAALNGDLAWQARTGPCPDTALTPRRTTDGGDSWTDSNATALTGVVAVQRIDVDSASEASFVGATRGGCNLTLVRTYVGGADYAEYPGQIGGEWWVVGAGSGEVHSPADGVVDTPCDDVHSLAVASASSAAVLCFDSTVVATTNSGQYWRGAATVPGAQAIAATDGGYLIARLGVDECDGVSIAAWNGDASSVDDVGCLESSEPAASLAGAVALSDGDGTLWVAIGDRVERSPDRGATWL